MTFNLNHLFLKNLKKSEKNLWWNMMNCTLRLPRWKLERVWGSFWSVESCNASKIDWVFLMTRVKLEEPNPPTCINIRNNRMSDPPVTQKGDLSNVKWAVVFCRCLGIWDVSSCPSETSNKMGTIWSILLFLIISCKTCYRKKD